MKLDRTWRRRAAAALLGAVYLTLTACGAAAAAAEEDGGIIDLNDPDVVIAAEVGTTTESDARSAYPDAQIVYVNSATDGLLAVTSGKADAYAMNLTAYESSVEPQRSDVTLHPDGVVGEGGDVVVGISPVTELPGAADLINGFIAEIKADGTLEDMNRRWETEHDYAMPEIPQAETPEYTITVGTSGLAEPYTFYQGSQVTGFDIELIERFALWCNAAVEFEVYDWNALTAACVSGKVDYIAADLFETPEKREVIQFSTPYAQVDTVMVIAQKDEDGAGFWSGIASSFEKTFLRENRWQLILSGLGVTLEIALCAGLAGTVLGFGLCLLLRSRFRLVRGLFNAFCTLIQGIPSLVVLMIIYFVVFASVSISPVVVGVIAFALLFAVAVAGILNTGINAVDPGQWEAATALGFSRAGAFVRVIMPQALRHVLPLYKGEFVSMLKLTSIVGYISIEDLTKAGDIIRSRTYEAFFPLIATAIIGHRPQAPAPPSAQGGGPRCRPCPARSRSGRPARRGADSGGAPEKGLPQRHPPQGREHRHPPGGGHHYHRPLRHRQIHPHAVHQPAGNPHRRQNHRAGPGYGLQKDRPLRHPPEDGHGVPVLQPLPPPDRHRKRDAGPHRAAEDAPAAGLREGHGPAANGWHG